MTDYIMYGDVGYPMKRHWVFVILIGLTIAAVAANSPTIKSTAEVPASVEVYFSPKGGCTEAVLREVAAAKRTIRVEAYSFTSDLIAQALLDAKKRKVDVQVILDRSQPTAIGGDASKLDAAGIPTWIDRKFTIAHSKVMIIDGKTVITGSFNFTKSAETSNAENLLVIRSRELSSQYTENWKRNLGYAIDYKQALLIPDKRPNFWRKLSSATLAPAPGN